MSVVGATLAAFALCLVAPNRAAQNTVGDPVAAKGAEAAEHYENERFAEALRVYRDAQLEDPESPLLKFNIGGALYKIEDLQGALAEFDEVSQQSDDALRASSLYNMGNVYFRQRQFPQAAQSFKEALAHDPQDEDARANLELALRYLQEQQQPQSGQKGESGAGEDDGEAEPGRQEQNEPRQQRAPEREDDQQESEREKGTSEEDEQRQDEPSDSPADADSEGSEQAESGDSVDDAAKMARQEAEQLLDAFRDREREAQRLRYRARQSNQPKDW